MKGIQKSSKKSMEQYYKSPVKGKRECLQMLTFLFYCIGPVKDQPIRREYPG